MTVITLLCVLLLLCPAKTGPQVSKTHLCFGFKRFLGRGTGGRHNKRKWYGIWDNEIYLTLPRGIASPILGLTNSSSNQSPQLHTHDPHTHCAQTTLQLPSTRTLQLYAVCTLFVCWSWSDSSLNLSCHLAPPRSSSSYWKWDKIPFLVPHRRRKKEEEGKKKKKKNIQEMKVVTRSSVCQTSPWAGTKGPEKSCWDYFSLQMTEEEGGCLRETWMDKDRKTDNGIFRLART